LAGSGMINNFKLKKSEQLDIFKEDIFDLLTAYIAFLIVWNLLKRKKWQEEILYIIILIPFLLRLFRLK
jgi:cell division protein FtsW (lipid II flippase)